MEMLAVVAMDLDLDPVILVVVAMDPLGDRWEAIPVVKEAEREQRAAVLELELELELELGLGLDQSPLATAAAKAATVATPRRALPQAKTTVMTRTTVLTTEAPSHHHRTAPTHQRQAQAHQRATRSRT